MCMGLAARYRKLIVYRGNGHGGPKTRLFGTNRHFSVVPIVAKISRNIGLRSQVFV
jgi:hypothetical protein